MRVIGMLRVKNEARWIERSVKSILPICNQVLVMDDHSTDGTADLCSALPGVTVLWSPFQGLDETRDKNWLLEHAKKLEPDWIVMIDGDEMLAPGGQEKLLEAMRGTDSTSISMRIPYLWDSEDQIRMDGVYGEYRRHSAFRPRNFVYTSSTPGGFHCGNVPARAMLHAVTIDARLLHFGYLHASDRERKYCWYNAKDPYNLVENQYRHIAAGLDAPHERLITTQQAMRKESGLPDLRAFEVIPPAPAANAKTAHAGPLTLQSLV